jgi:glycosyltransferase involved in cell wall biosynthesis
VRRVAKSAGLVTKSLARRGRSKYGISSINMPRIAVVTSHPIQYYAPLFRELARRLDLHVFYMHRVTVQDQAQAGFGVGFQWDVDLLSGYASSFLNNVARQPGLHHFKGVEVPSVGAALRQGRFDAVLVTGWHLKGYVEAIWAAKWYGLPVMVRGDSQMETQRSFAKRAAKELVYPLVLRAFDAALYVGARSKAYWRHYHCPESRLFFSPHCVDNDWFAAQAADGAGSVLRERLGVSPNASIVLFAGKLQPFKRPLDVIDACSLLRANGKDAQVLVAGTGELKQSIRERAAALGVPVHMLGFVNQSQMPAAYAAADVLVLPSTSSETWGLVANEALACSTPIVVSDACGCAPDLAADNVAGATYAMGDVQALAYRLSGLLEHPPSADQIARKISQYSVPSAADGIQAAALAIARKSGARTR